MEKCIIAIVCLCAYLSTVRCLQTYESEEDIRFHYRKALLNVQDRLFDNDAKNLIVDLHNFYRSNVTPPAADMKLMEWDDELEQTAQAWADRCSFEYRKSHDGYSKGIFGQTIYYGTDRTGYAAVRKWYGTAVEYDVKTKTCKSNGSCADYKQVVWSRSFRIGCGVTKCGAKYQIVCNYFESAIYGQDVYTIGEPCSQCRDKMETLCWNNLCISQDQCERNRSFCELEASCDLECHNCGQLNATTCQCACPDGWDSRDCSRPCQDQNEKCGRSPGFETTSYCSVNNYKVRDAYCRKMCGQCNAVSEDSEFKCCDGKVCEKGYVLNTETCLCKKLCPGPLCDENEDEKEVSSAKKDVLREKELQLIEKEKYLTKKEKILDKRERFLQRKQRYLEKKEKFLKEQESHKKFKAYF